MAVSDCIRECRRCGKSFQRTAKGQPTKFCSIECRDWKAVDHRPTRICAACGGHFGATGTTSLYCSLKCRADARNKRRRQHGLPAIKVDKHCLECSAAMHVRRRTMYCSRGCARARICRIKREVEPIVVQVRRGPCAACGRQITMRHGGVKYCGQCKAAAQGWRSEEKDCMVCGARFIQQTRWQKACSEHCSKASTRKAGRIAKARRRAVTRGRAAELIDPIKVFERDGWRCQLCLMKLRPEDRGTYKGAAPELDHIIPLAAGGTHTWANVQCACRRCNNQKGSKPLGQMNLPMAA